MDKYGKKLNAIWDELRTLPERIGKSVDSQTEQHQKHYEKQTKRDGRRDDLLKDIRDKDFEGVTKEQMQSIVKDYFDNHVMSVEGEFYPKTQKVEGEVKLTKADITTISDEVYKAIKKGIVIPETKIPEQRKTVGIDGEVQVFGKVEASAPMPAHKYLALRLSNGKQFVDVEALLAQILEVLKKQQASGGAYAAGTDAEDKQTFADIRDNIVFADSPQNDAFARLRVSEPLTIFDSKQIHNNAPLFFDDQQTTGTGTDSVWLQDEAASTISVGATAGTRVRQTYQRFNYQPGKSQLILVTFAEFDTATGVSKRTGLFDERNGLFFCSESGTVGVCRRSSVSGTAVDDVVTQDNWNIDKLDGTGASGITLDASKSNIGIIDFEWLGVGRVRMGFVIDGVPVYAHHFNNANNLATVYMSTPNLPIRYEISNDGTGAADEFVHICSSVQSEGGQQATGILRHTDTAELTGMATNTEYGMLAIRLKDANLDAVVEMVNISLFTTSGNDSAHWEIRFNPVIAGAVTWVDSPNSTVQIAYLDNTNIVSLGTEIDGGFFAQQLPVTVSVPNALRLGSAIDGTPDTIVLSVRPITNNMSAVGSVTWRELS